MASHPSSAVPASEWQTSSHAYTRGQLMACMRAGVIALVLLGVLALIVCSDLTPTSPYKRRRPAPSAIARPAVVVEVLTGGG